MADLDDLLAKTSRTFALSIPPLPEPTRREVTVAYLLFRIIDTVEDASHWPKAQRIEALAAFRRLLAAPAPEPARALARSWHEAGLTSHPGYAELMGELPFVLDAFAALPGPAAEQVRSHVQRSAAGMSGFVARTDGDGALRLHSLADLGEYCYAVAGIVGEMLTELFLLDAPVLQAIAPGLRQRAVRFGEALQLVNILKDSAGDAAEGRRYLPEEVPVDQVFERARRDLVTAEEYVLGLQQGGAPPGFLEFTALPVRLAWASLDAIESRGPGAKVSRAQVWAIRSDLRQALERGAPAVAEHLPSAPRP